MNQKVLIMLLIIGILFVGSGVFGLFNGDLLFNDSSSLDSTNVNTIQNKSSTVIKEIAYAEDNDLVNIDISSEYTNYYPNFNKTDLLLKYVESNGVNRTLATFHRLDSNSSDITGGYNLCSECGLFIPIGNLLNLVPDEYLCKCDDMWFNSNEVTPMYSEENILNFVYEDIFVVKNDPYKIHLPYYKSTSDHIYRANVKVNAVNHAVDGLNTDLNHENNFNDSKVVDSSNDVSSNNKSVEKPKSGNLFNPFISGYSHPGEDIVTANITYCG